MGYDIFDTYRRRLNESVDSRFDDVVVQDDVRPAAESREEMFDRAFESVYGIKSGSPRRSLTEKFTGFPDWLVAYLSKDHYEIRNLKKQLTADGIDLARAKYVPDQLPRNGRDPKFKDTSKLAVFRLKRSVDSNEPQAIYIPGYTDPGVYVRDGNGYTNFFHASVISKKSLLQLTTEYGYIDLTDATNSNRDIRKERAAARSGMPPQRDRSKQGHLVTNTVYGKDERGRTDFNNILGQEQHWVLEKGYDRSGYRLNPSKYKDMLDRVGMSDYTVRLNSFYKRIEAYRERLIAVMGKFNTRNATKFVAKSTWASTIFEDIADATKALSAAIGYYTKLERELDNIMNSGNPDDNDIRWTFQFQAPAIRQYLEETNKYLKALETAKEREAPMA